MYVLTFLMASGKSSQGKGKSGGKQGAKGSEKQGHEYDHLAKSRHPPPES